MNEIIGFIFEAIQGRCECAGKKLKFHFGFRLVTCTEMPPAPQSHLGYLILFFCVPRFFFSQSGYAFKGFLLSTKATVGLIQGVPTPGSPRNRLPGLPGLPDPGSPPGMSNVKNPKCQKNCFRIAQFSNNALALLGCQQISLIFLSCQKLLWHC